MGKAPQNKILMIACCVIWPASALGIGPLMMGHKNWWWRLAGGFLTCGAVSFWWGLYDAYCIFTGSMKMADGKELK